MRKKQTHRDISNRLIEIINDALDTYRCQYSDYEDNGGGMFLVDMLTPQGETTITKGCNELRLLADHVAAFISAGEKNE